MRLLQTIFYFHVDVTTVTFIYNKDISSIVEFTMKTKLRVVEVRLDKTIELPEKIIPVKLEPVIEPSGLTVPVPSGRFFLYYLEE